MRNVTFRVVHVEEDASDQPIVEFRAPVVPFKYHIPEPPSLALETFKTTEIDSGDPPQIRDFGFKYGIPKYINTDPRITAVWSEFLVDSRKKGVFLDVEISKSNLVYIACFILRWRGFMICYLSRRSRWK